MLKQKQLHHPCYCSHWAQRPLQAQLTCALAQQRGEQGCCKPSDRDISEALLLLGHFCVNYPHWPCFIGLQMCLVNSWLVEAQRHYKHGRYRKGTERSLQVPGSSRCGVSAASPLAQENQALGRFCASTGEITKDNKINLPGQCKLQLCLWLCNWKRSWQAGTSRILWKNKTSKQTNLQITFKIKLKQKLINLNTRIPLTTKTLYESKCFCSTYVLNLHIDWNF